LAAGCATPLLAQDTTPLIPNGNFETDADGDQWPDKWGHLKEGGSYESEEGNHFLRLTSTTPGKMILLYTPVNIPEGTKALEFTWRQRVSNLKVGKNSWFDARIMMDFKDAEGKKMKGAPGAPYTRKDTNGWVDKSIKFLVPEGAKMLELMPTLFQVESGTFDLDDITLKPTDPGNLAEIAAAKATAAEAKQAKQAEVRQTKAAAAVAANDGSLISNGDFEQANKDGQFTADWGRADASHSWEAENGNHFLRITSTEPDKMFLSYREFVIPAGTPALELTWKQRTSNLKPGKEMWFDARIMMNFKDAAGKKIGSPSAPYTRSNSDGWVEKSARFLVPEGAVSLEFMPSLFQVKSGTLDLDDISLKPTDPAPLKEAAAKAAEDAKFANVPWEDPQPAKWPQELHVVGNQIVAKDGKRVWLQGVNVVSLEFLVKGDHVLRSELVAMEDWKSNIIRLPVKGSFWFGKGPGQKDGGEGYRKLVDAAINIVANRGGYVLLDLHHFHAPKMADVDFWKDAATRYKDHPAVLFDIFNEPHGVSWDVWRNGGLVQDKNAPADEDNFLTPEEKAQNAQGYHSPGMQALVDAVRGTGAKNIIAAGGLDWAYDLSGIAKGYALDDKGGNGIIYSTHIYAGKKDWANKVLLIADKYPIIVGELGANNQKFSFIPADQQEDATTWVPAVLGLIQKYKLNWTAFSMHPKASPVLISNWDYTPTPEWGAFAKRALAGEQFPAPQLR
jgi:hypothetical protein